MAAPNWLDQARLERDKCGYVVWRGKSPSAILPKPTHTHDLPPLCVSTWQRGRGHVTTTAWWTNNTSQEEKPTCKMSTSGLCAFYTQWERATTTTDCIRSGKALGPGASGGGTRLLRSAGQPAGRGAAAGDAHGLRRSGGSSPRLRPLHCCVPKQLMLPERPRWWCRSEICAQYVFTLLLQNTH